MLTRNINHLCCQSAQEKFLFKGWSITPAGGGQFVLAKAENVLRREVVSLVRPEGFNLSDFSN